MNAVMAWTASSGLKVRFGRPPAARYTIIVSPTALETARMKDDTIPDRAAGTTTLVATSKRVAPNA